MSASKFWSRSKFGRGNEPPNSSLIREGKQKPRGMFQESAETMRIYTERQKKLITSSVAAPGGGMGGQMPPQLEALPPHLPPQSEWDFFFFFLLFFFFYLCRKSHQSPI